jgi:enoyl-CoA hydratase/carnithine racemase
MNRALLTAFRPSSATAKSIRTNASLVQITDEPIVRRITMINLKQRNPLGLDMIRALQSAVDTTDFARCRVLVLGSADDKIFSAGHNLKELTAEKGRQMHQLVFDEFSKLCLDLQGLPVPVIAEVKGE